MKLSAKVTIHLPENLTLELEEFAKRHGMSRSALVSGLCRRWKAEGKPWPMMETDREIYKLATTRAKLKQQIVLRLNAARARAVKARRPVGPEAVKLLKQLDREGTKISRATLHMMVQQYRDEGLAGLLDKRNPAVRRMLIELASRNQQATRKDARKGIAGPDA